MSKARPPIINPEWLTRQSPIPKQVAKLRMRFRLLEIELNEGRVGETYIALEGLAAICEARLSVESDEEFRAAWPQEWTSASVSVPYVLLQQIANAWSDYKAAPSGKTLGEVFKIEGQGQGKKRTRDLRKTADEQYARAREVLLEFLSRSLAGAPMSVSKVQGLVAESRGESLETIQDAYSRYGPVIMSLLRADGAFLEE